MFFVDEAAILAAEVAMEDALAALKAKRRQNFARGRRLDTRRRPWGKINRRRLGIGPQPRPRLMIGGVSRRSSRRFSSSAAEALALATRHRSVAPSYAPDPPQPPVADDPAPSLVRVFDPPPAPTKPTRRPDPPAGARRPPRPTHLPVPAGYRVVNLAAADVRHWNRRLSARPPAASWKLVRH